MCRKRGLRVYIQALQFVCALCDFDQITTLKKATELLLRESCQASLISVPLSYGILRKSGRLTSKQTLHLDTDYRTQYRTALYLGLRTVVKNRHHET